MKQSAAYPSYQAPFRGKSFPAVTQEDAVHGAIQLMRFVAQTIVQKLRDQRMPQNLFHPADIDNLQAFRDLCIHFHYIRLVLRRHKHCADAGFFAASSFSFSPPIGSTLPRSVISPVIARSARTGLFVIAESMAVAIVIPADGPSFGTAPSGMWIWISFPVKKSSGI